MKHRIYKLFATTVLMLIPCVLASGASVYVNDTYNDIATNTMPENYSIIGATSKITETGAEDKAYLIRGAESPTVITRTVGEFSDTYTLSVDVMTDNEAMNITFGIESNDSSMFVPFIKVNDNKVTTPDGRIIGNVMPGEFTTLTVTVHKSVLYDVYINGRAVLLNWAMKGRITNGNIRIEKDYDGVEWPIYIDNLRLYEGDYIKKCIPKASFLDLRVEQLNKDTDLGDYTYFDSTICNPSTGAYDYFYAYPNKMYYAYAPTMLRFIALCGIDDAIYVDDVKVYSGTYSGGTAPFVVTQDEELASVDGEKYEIEIFGDELDVSSLGDYISCDGAYTVYTDSSLSDVVVGKMTNGNVLIAKKDGLYNYYTLKIANRLIADAGKLIVDPYEMTITVPDIITTKALIENITLSDTGNSIKVYDGENEAIDVKVSDTMVLRITTSDGEYDFAIITAPSYKLSYTSGGFSPNTDVFNATVVAELKDLFNMNYKPVMIIAGYDANGLKSVKFTQDTDWKDGVLTMSYTPDEAVTDVQIMVWDNLSNITPIMCKELKYAENLISTPVNIYLVGDSICQK